MRKRGLFFRTRAIKKIKRSQRVRPRLYINKYSDRVLSRGTNKEKKLGFLRMATGEMWSVKQIHCYLRKIFKHVRR